MLSTGAADGVDPGSLAEPFLREGLLGTALVACVLLLLLMVRRDWKRQDRLEADYEALQKVTREQLMPALVRATDGLGRMGELTGENVEALKQVHEVLAQAREALRDRRHG